MAKPRSKPMSDRALAAAIAREEATEDAAIRRALIARGTDPLQPTVAGPIAARTGHRGVAGRPYRGASGLDPTHYALPGDVTRRVAEADDERDDAAWEAAAAAGRRRTADAPSVARAAARGATLEREEAAAQANQVLLDAETARQQQDRDAAEARFRMREAERLKRTRQEAAVRGPGRV